MTRRQATELELEYFQDDAEIVPAEPPARRLPDRVPASLRFTQQSDGSFAGAIPFTEDRERWKRAIRGATDARGVFNVEVRNKGQAILRKDVIEVAPESLTGGQHATAAQPQSAAQPVEQSSARSINDTTETIRATKELIKEVTPQAKQDAMTREDVREMMREMLAGLVEQLKPTSQPAQPPADPFELVSRVVKLQKELMPEQPQPVAQSGDEFDRVLNLMERIDTLRERVNPGGSYDGESVGTLDKVLRFADRHGDKLAALPQLLSLMQPGRVQEMVAAMGVGDATQPQRRSPQHAAPQPTQQGPTTEAEAVSLILAVAVNELTRNKRVGHTADLIEELRVRFPALDTPIRELVKMQPAQLLNLMEVNTGRTDLASFGHATEWVSILQNELHTDDGDEGEDLEGADVVAHAGSSNGAGAVAAVKD